MTILLRLIFCPDSLADVLDPCPWRRAYRALKQKEATQARWANPLSIYGPDPQRLAVVMFNAGQKERRAEMSQQLDQLRRQVAVLREREGLP